MNNLMKTALAACVLATATGSAMAADSVDLKVIGTITPASCTPTLEGGGIVDYGNIRAQDLSATNYKMLPEKQVAFTITCDATASVAVRAFSGRPGSVAGSNEGSNGIAIAPAGVTFSSGGNPVVAGLGKASNNNAPIGGYRLQFVNGSSKADGNAVDHLISYVTPSSFVRDSTNLLWTLNQDAFITWASQGSSTPIGFRVLTGKLAVEAYINKASLLDTSSAITLDGLATLELVYL